MDVFLARDVAQANPPLCTVSEDVLSPKPCDIEKICVGDVLLGIEEVSDPVRFV